MASLPLLDAPRRDPLVSRDAIAVPAASARSWRECTGDRAFLANWHGLASQASEPNPFLEPWCLAPALQAHDPRNHCRLLCVEDETGLVGLLPIVRTGSYYGYPLPNLANWMHDNAFVGAPLVRTGHEERFWSSLLAWADKQAHSAMFLHLAHLDEHGSLVGALRQVTRQSGRPAAIVHREERAMLCSELSPDAYLDGSMSGKKRKELRRQQRRLEECGTVTFHRQQNEEALDQWVGEFLSLEAAGWKGANGSALACHSSNAAMFGQILAGAAQAGKLERLRIDLDGQPIAMLANFLSAPGSFSYKTTYDENFARYSPGVLLQLENLALLKRPDIDWCDSCASADHPMIDRIWREKRTIVRASIAIGGRARQAIGRQIIWHENRKTSEGYW